MDWRERIVTDPNILVGKPTVKGTRLAVEFVVGLLAEGWTQDEILENYPRLTREDLQACLKYAAELLHEMRFFPLESMPDASTG